VRVCGEGVWVGGCGIQGCNRAATIYQEVRVQAYRGVVHTMKGGFLKLNYYHCQMGRESWHAIKKLFNLPFLTLKVRYPAIS